MKKKAKDYLFDSRDILEEISTGGTRQNAQFLL